MLSERVHVEYKCSDFYDPGHELGIAWNDPDIGIAWPIRDPILSSKDSSALRLAEVLDQLTPFQG